MLAAASEKHEQPLPNVPDLTAKEKLHGEKEMLGFYVTGHPLDEYMDKVCELAHSRQRHRSGSRKGRRSEAVRHHHRHPAKPQQGRKAVGGHAIRGSKGSLEAMVFTTQYDRLLTALVEDKAVLVRAHVAAGRGRSAEDLGPGHRAARKRPRRSIRR